MVVVVVAAAVVEVSSLRKINFAQTFHCFKTSVPFGNKNVSRKCILSCTFENNLHYSCRTVILSLLQLRTLSLHGFFDSSKLY